MTDLLLQTGLSNAVFSAVLVLVALVAQSTLRRPHLAWLLWLIVILKLITPPLVTLPVLPAFGLSGLASGAAGDHGQGQLPGVAGSLLLSGADRASESWPGVLWSWTLLHGKTGILAIWIAGSITALAFSLGRVRRFNRLLDLESEQVPPELQGVADSLAGRFGIRSVPRIQTTSAGLTPLVWWTGGKVRIVIPAALLERLNTRETAWIVAHELAHVRRRDHLVRWVEWFACVCFWWNPLVWWAGRQLRANEEICCDAFVLATLNPKPKAYAKSLLAAIDHLATPAFRPPTVASAINSGGSLERRFNMILSGTSRQGTSRALHFVVLLAAVVVLPLGLVYAQDKGDVAGSDDLGAYLSKKETEVRDKVAAGELTAEEGREEMAAVKEAVRLERIKNHLEQVRAELARKVETGEITEKEATKRTQEAEQDFQKKMKTYDDQAAKKEIKTYLEEVRARLDQKVESGEITEEAARKQLQEAEENFQKKMNTYHEQAAEKEIKTYLMEVRAKLDQKVKSGEITKEAADKELQETYERLKRRKRADNEEAARWAEIEKGLQQSVEEGKMTREEAEAKYREIKERTAAREAHEGEDHDNDRQPSTAATDTR